MFGLLIGEVSQVEGGSEVVAATTTCVTFSLFDAESLGHRH